MAMHQSSPQTITTTFQHLPQVGLLGSVRSFNRKAWLHAGHFVPDTLFNKCFFGLCFQGTLWSQWLMAETYKKSQGKLLLYLVVKKTRASGDCLLWNPRHLTGLSVTGFFICEMGLSSNYLLGSFILVLPQYLDRARAWWMLSVIEAKGTWFSLFKVNFIDTYQSFSYSVLPI